MKEFYTAGELAKLTGVSYKTIRHYLDKGMIEPDYLTDSGYRMYGRMTIEKMQRILMLKYLDFSLDEIKEMLDTQELDVTFKRQEELLLEKKNHLEQVLLAVREIEKVDEEEKWAKMINIINMTSRKEELIKQYSKGDNLQKRINIHEYSTSTEGWYDWLFDRLKLQVGMKILDIGCGNGQIWVEVRDRLPNNLKIILTDNSEGMLKEASNNIKKYKNLFDEKNIEFTFIHIDAEDFRINENEFDRIMANHMLYHVSNEKRADLLRTCRELLSKNGIFIASTVGNTHFKEMFELICKFDKSIKTPNWISENFELENGAQQLEKIFSYVDMEKQKNDLLVPDSDAIYEYIISLPGNISESIKMRCKEFKKFLKENVSQEKPYFIHKSAGVFRAHK